MKPRRRKKSAVARARPFWILIVLLLAAGIAGGYYAARWPGFRVREVTVSGNLVVSRADILHRAAIDGRQNIWLQNMRRASERIRALPYVDDARIHRALPARVRIEITERKPYAILRSGSDEMLIDSDLRVLELGAAPVGLPIFFTPVPRARPGDFLRDAGLAAMVRDFQTLRNGRVTALSLRLDRLGDLTVVIPPGITLELGDDSDLAEKTALIDPILSQTQVQGRRVRSLDLRAPKTPVLVFRQ